MKAFRITGANGEQVFELARNANGAWQVGIQFFDPPSAGTASIDYMLVGESEWRSAPLGADIDLTDPAAVYVYGNIRYLRLTIADLVGGAAGGFLYAQVGTAMGFLPHHFTDGLGPESRLQVDVGQTGFFRGREFRTFRRLNMTLAEIVVIKAVVPINIILFGLQTTLVSGQIDIETAVGGTEGGTFSETLPVFARNNMSDRPTPFYTPQVVLTAGGTHADGTVLDVLLNKTADNANFAASVGSEPQDERGIGAGTYYIRITAVAACTGVLKARWEERPGPVL